MFKAIKKNSITILGSLKRTIIGFKWLILAIPVILLLINLFKLGMSYFFPDDYQSSLPSLIDYTFTGGLKTFIISTMALMLMSSVFYGPYIFLTKNLNFDQLKHEAKVKYSLIIFFGFLFAIVLAA